MLNLFKREKPVIFKREHTVRKKIWIDETNKMLKLKIYTLGKPSLYMPFDDILDVRITEKIVDQESKTGVGKAVAGGLLFGGAGAVVGAVTGRRKAAQVIQTMLVEVVTKQLKRNGKNKVESIVVIAHHEEVKRDSYAYEQALEEAAELVAALQQAAAAA